MEATVKRDQTNQLCAKGDHIISYKVLPHVLNVKRATHAEEAIELFVLLVHLVTLDKKIVLNALLDLSALKDHHSQQSVNQELIVEWVHQIVLHVMPVTTALVVHLSSRDVVMAQPVMPGKKIVQCVPLVIIALEDSNFPVLLALSAAQLVRL